MNSAIKKSERPIKSQQTNGGRNENFAINLIMPVSTLSHTT